MKLTQTYLTDFAALLFPQLCVACRQSLVANEHLICTGCHFGLPYTDFHLQADNIVARQFWGRLDLQAAYALFYFTKGGRVQNMMHQFKYRGLWQIGNLLGEIAGTQLGKNAAFTTAEVIIPVPLHKRRLKERGYNQSACFAAGLAEKLSAKVDAGNLIRARATETQTHKSRFLRFQNMAEVFVVKHPERLENKHILLVDDVVTTGSTLEACGLQLLKIEGVKLSVAAIAYAE